MLRLDKLEIRGFKSFCDFTEVVFHEGITAIVGPNGCGKSNVMDAVIWVLGEQSAKNLRGGKMEDIIFNGTRDRKPLGMAEVLLTFTAVADIEPDKNLEDDLSTEDLLIPEIPIEEIEESLQQQFTGEPDQPASEVSSEESSPAKTQRRGPRKFRIPTLVQGEKITIGRRLYRSGESDYLINGRTCRLRDILDFFSGTGLSRARYAIIEQGRIGQVLSSKPHDRRALIEEAAGVAKFKAKRHAAEVKLESTRQNLSRLNDLTSEIERQVNSLKRQASKARRYVALRDEMRAALRAFFIRTAQQLKESHHAVSTAFDACTSQLEHLTSQTQLLTAQTAEARQFARSAEDQLTGARQYASEVNLECDRATNLRKHLCEQIEQMVLRQRELASEATRLAERRHLVVHDLEASRLKNEQLGVELSGDEKRLSGIEARYKAESQKLQESERQQEQVRSQLIAHITRIERLRNQEQQHHDLEARLIRQAQNLESEGQRAIERHLQAVQELESATETRDALTTQIQGVRETLAALNTEVNRGTEAVKQAQIALTTAQRERTRVEDRLGSLRNLDEHHAYYSSTVKTLLHEAKKIPGLHVVGTLADFLNVPSAYESLVETVLGDRVQSILVPTMDMAVSAATWLEGNKGGRATFLVTGFQGAEGDPPAATSRKKRLADGEPDTGNGLSFLSVLGLSSQFNTVFSRALPQLAEAHIASSLDEALDWSAQDPTRLFLTPDGAQVLGCSLLVTRGSEKPPTSVLALKREIKELTAKIAELDEAVHQQTLALEKVQTRLTEHKAQQRETDGELRELENRATAASVELKQRQRDVERADQHCHVVESEKTQLARERAQLAERLAQTKTELEQAEVRHKSLESEFAVAQEKLTALRPSVEQISEELSLIRADVAARLERRRSASSELRRLENEIRDVEHRQGQLELEQVEARGRLETHKQQLTDCEAQIVTSTTAQLTAAEKVTKAVMRLETLRSRADELEEKLNQLRSNEKAVREARSSHEIEQARIISEYEHVVKTCRSELSEHLEELLATETVPDARTLEELSTDLDDLREKIEALGPVNMLALEELEEATKRHEFLIAQRADVIDAIAITEEALKEIRKRTRQRFLEAFNQINDHFAKVFQELFGGGRGEMILIDQEDVLESGIDLIAQPPGKRLQSVLLLSGGEKAMVALALVLAIFRYKPSPFCILDEVDAPLDDANIGRFAQKIGEMSQQTQFLVITHNKQTMESAQSIYGVTMPEPGVSKLMSVKFE